MSEPKINVDECPELRQAPPLIFVQFAQGDLEAQLELPVNPLMNRKTAVIPKQQLGFYNFVAKPMFEVFDLLVPMEGPLSNLKQMSDYWQVCP